MMLNTHRVRSAVAALVLCLPLLAHAQIEGRVSDSKRGLEFVLPNGWVGQQTHEGYAFQSAAMPGVLLVLYHDYDDVNTLSESAIEGLEDDEGTSLAVDGDIASYGKNGIQTMFAGTVQWQPAKAYAIGLVSPHGGGISIIVAASTDAYTAEHKRAVEALAASVVFSKPNIGPVVQQWKGLLTGMKLTYMNSYNSGSGGGGYSDKEVIDLCPDGSFGFYSSSSTVVNADGAGAYSGGQSGGAGQWNISSSMGKAQLVLEFNSGETSSYTLEYNDDKLFLNGYRYFRTNDAACNW